MKIKVTQKSRISRISELKTWLCDTLLLKSVPEINTDVSCTNTLNTNILCFIMRNRRVLIMIGGLFFLELELILS